MADAALIEVEGVVFDTRELRRASLNQALLDQGMALDLEPELVDGRTPRAAIAALLSARRVEHDDVIVDLLTLRAERAFSSKLATNGAAMREGARDFVREAAAATRLAIVTRARRADLDTMLRLAGLTEFFGIVITADDVLEPKPASDGHRLALERLNRQRPIGGRGALAIEDSLAGIRAARSVGLRCVAVGPLATHLAIEADAYVPSLNGQTMRALELLARPGRERVQ
jgi:HAD superfamily hydrolase (TIGR01509 family)